MSTKARTTVRLGDLVVVAFDWAEQMSSDPRDVPLLATKAVEHLLTRVRKPSAPLQAAVFPLSGDFGDLLGAEAAGGQPGGLTSAGVCGAGR